MTTALANAQEGLQALPEAIEQALIVGDLKGLSIPNRIIYYNRICQSIGLNPLTKPFGYIELNGKLTLYALKDCTDQIRNIKSVSVTEMTGKLEGEIYTVTAKGQDKTGRCDASTGAVDVTGLRGEKKANAYMKAETKAKRRLTLSLCGLGMLDESEVDSIAGARIIEHQTVTTAPAPAPATGQPEPEAVADAAKQKVAGEESQLPPGERPKPVVVDEAPKPSAKFEELLKKLDEEMGKAKSRGEVIELWEAFQKLVGPTEKLTLETGWAIRAKNSRRIAAEGGK